MAYTSDGKFSAIGQDLVTWPMWVEERGEQLVQIDRGRVGDDHLVCVRADERGRCALPTIPPE
jgi:hypothetical protein